MNTGYLQEKKMWKRRLVVRVGRAMGLVRRGSSERWGRAVPWIVFGLLLVLRLAALGRYKVSSDAMLQRGDAFAYMDFAQELVENGSIPSRFRGSYLRPPGYPLVVGGLLMASADEETLCTNVWRLNVLADTGTVLLCFVLACSFRRERLYRCVAAGVLALQPWTAAYCNSMWPDTLVVFLVVLSAFLFTLAVKPRKARHQLVCLVLGTGALSASALFRSEMILVPPVIACIYSVLVYRRLRGVLVSGVACASVFLAVAGVMCVYSQYVKGTPNLWIAPAYSETRGLFKWVQTWPGDQRVKMKLCLNLPAGEDFDPSLLPPSVFGSAREKAYVLRLIDTANERGVTTEVNESFMELARNRRAQHPLRCGVLIRAHTAWMFWWDVRPMDGWRNTLFRWCPRKVQGIFLSAMKAVAIVLFSVLPAFVDWRCLSRHRIGVFSVLVFAYAFVALRILTFWSVAYPESRYMLPGWPCVLLADVFALSLFLRWVRGFWQRGRHALQNDASGRAKNAEDNDLVPLALPRWPLDRQEHLRGGCSSGAVSDRHA